MSIPLAFAGAFWTIPGSVPGGVGTVVVVTGTVVVVVTGTVVVVVTSHACDLRREAFHDVVVQLQGGETRVHAEQGIHVDCGMVVGGFYPVS